MREGWYQDDYLILFDESEVASVSERYTISKMLPGYQVLGLLGWDDFIVRDTEGRTYTVPTVPALPQHLSPFSIPEKPSLSSDPRFLAKVKWYLMPVVFGGDANVGKNVVWVDHDQHAQLVRWWNENYRSLKTGSMTDKTGRSEPA